MKQLSRALEERDEARRERDEALAFQAASNEILAAISRSTSDAKPVFDAIVDCVRRLFGTRYVAVFLVKGEELHLAAAKSDAHFEREKAAVFRRFRDSFPQRIDWGGFTGKALRSGKVSQIAPIIGNAKATPQAVKLAKQFGYNAMLVAPLVRDGKAIGAIGTTRPEPEPFAARELALFKAFAAQAVVAIENARLFNETKEALERQTATSEVLRVISGTPADPQPVFEAIAQSAARVFNAPHTVVSVVEGDLLHLKATAGQIDPRQLPRIPFDRTSTSGSALLEKTTVDVPDTEAVGAPPFARDSGRAVGFRAIASAPMLREGKGIGAITVMRAQPGALTDKQRQLLQTFADQAVIAIENARLFNETKEALEQQTASSEILRVISRTPGDVQPVFDSIVNNCSVLFRDSRVALWQISEGALTPRASTGYMPEPIPLDRESAIGACVLESRTLHLPDLRSGAEQYPRVKQLGLKHGYLSGVYAPLLREGQAIGGISVLRRELGAFSDKEVALLRTFADQAVIAIENARLFNETKEALERQMAISDILRVISGSPADVKPVLDTVAAHAARICHAQTVDIALAEGLSLRIVASVGDEGRVLGQELPLDRSTVSGRSIVDRAPVHVADMQEAGSEFPLGSELAHKYGFRTILGVPLLREGRALGAIMVRRAEVRPLEAKHVALLKTFADQAAIAIENARLFNETKEALEQQTASAEILKVISASPSDVQPVFDAVAETAARVCGVDDVAILRTEGNDLRRVAHYGSVPVTPDSRVPVPRGSVNERVLSEHRTLHIPDTLAPSFTREFPGSQFPAMGVRALLATPLVHDGVAVGVIHLRRSEPRPFTDKQIALLETFAAQAVIAIENVRLFNETRDALERQTATGEILASMSESMTDTKPVFDAIVRNLLRLFGSGYAVVSLRRGQVNELAGFQGEPGFERLEEVYPIPVDEHTISGEAMLSRQVKKYAPVVDNPAVPRRTAELGQRFGFNSIMTAPMMWKGEAIGVILTARRQALPFDDKQVALIQSFADQAVIAIENVRLFKELQQRTESLTRSVDQLTALGEVGRAISSMLELDEVLRTIVQRAVQLAGMDAGSIYEFDVRDQRFHLRAAQNVAEDILTVYRKSPIRIGEGAIGRAGATREPVMVEDVLNESYRSRAREALIKSGVRALLAVPLLGEELVLGALVVSRKSPGPFAREVIDLLNTFATQSAVAIQNARLFREIAEKSIQLEEASRHKSQFLASMSHELRTPLNAILGFNEMILGQVYGEVPPDMKEPLEDIQKSGKHLLRLINNVLDLAKIEAGRMELALADYSVQDTVESVRSTLRPLAEAKGLELVASVPEDIPLAYGDGGRLAQCLMNLAGNSLKFTKQGKVEIAVRANDGLLIWRVSDTGIGIPSDKIPTLFSEFKQTDATIASEYGGTGLGLSITKKFVEMHGGRISVESELGKGSAFTIEIPLRATARA